MVQVPQDSPASVALRIGITQRGWAERQVWHALRKPVRKRTLGCGHTRVEHERARNQPAAPLQDPDVTYSLLLLVEMVSGIIRLHILHFFIIELVL